MDQLSFLTEQHSNTLDGLHREIQKLQGRCNELTFKLHFPNNEFNNTEEYSSDSLNQLNTIDSLQTQLEDVTQSLGAELHHKSEVINEMENQLLAAQNEISILTEKQRYSQSEIESNSKTIAVLTNSLQQIKSKLAQAHITIPTSVSLQKRSKPLQPISNSVFFSEEEFQSPTYRSLPPSFDRMSSPNPKILVPTPPAELPKNRTSNMRYQRRYSAPRLRSNSNDSLPLALLSEDKIQLASVPSKTNKKLILPPIPNATRESHSRSGPMVGNLQSPQTFKHPSKTTRSTHVKDF